MDHSTHGKGDQDGPFDPDCICRGTELQSECARAGCGFCLAAEPIDFSDELAPDWTQECENCGATPIVPLTGLCGPCTFGEAKTAEGDW